MPTNVIVTEKFESDVQNPVTPVLKSLVMGPLHQIRKRVSFGQYLNTDTSATVLDFPGVYAGATPNVYWYETVVSDAVNKNARWPHLTEDEESALTFIEANPELFEDFMEVDDTVSASPSTFSLFHSHAVPGSVRLGFRMTVTTTASATLTVNPTDLGIIDMNVVTDDGVNLVDGEDYSWTTYDTTASFTGVPSSVSSGASAYICTIDVLCPTYTTSGASGINYLNIDYDVGSVDVSVEDVSGDYPSSVTNGVLGDWYTFILYNFYPVIGPSMYRLDRLQSSLVRLSPADFTVKQDVSGDYHVHILADVGDYIDTYTPTSTAEITLASGAAVTAVHPSATSKIVFPEHSFLDVVDEYGDVLTGGTLHIFNGTTETTAVSIVGTDYDGGLFIAENLGGSASGASYVDLTFKAAFSDYSCAIYGTFSALRTDKSDTIYSVSTPSEVLSQLGFGGSNDSDFYNEPANPLAYGLQVALTNGSNSYILAATVESDTVSAYQEILETIGFDRTVYEIFPLTYTQVLHDQVASHVDFYSNDLNTGDDKKRACMISPKVEDAEVLGDVANDDASIRVSFHKPSYPDTQTIRLDVSSVISDFVQDGIVVGDRVRILHGDIAGDYRISNVIKVGETSHQIDLINDLDATWTAPTATTVYDFSGGVGFITYRWYAASKDSYKTAIAAAGERYRSAAYNYRIKMLWPYLFEECPIDEGTSIRYATLPGYFAACAYAGLFSVIQPHQGLTRYPILGTGDPLYSNDFFTYLQLNAIENAAWWIISKKGSSVFCREQYTQAGGTGGNALSSQRSIVCVADTISKRLHDTLYVYTGVYNITPENIPVFRQAAEAVLHRAKQESYDRIGSLIINGRIDDITVDTTRPRTLLVKAKIVAPEPVDVFDVTLYVSRYTG